MTLIAAADGSALGNPGPAGWAWYIDAEHWASGGWAHGTNNMGELTAVLDLLRQTEPLDEDLLIYCDSLYVINSCTKWMPSWKRKGWRKGDGKPVLNVEIMKALDDAMQGRRVRFEWVKGHSGHPLNEEADRLANAAAVACSQGRQPVPGPGIGHLEGRAEGVASTPAHAPAGLSMSRSEGPFVDADPYDDTDLFSSSEPTTDEHHVLELERSLLSDQVRSDPSSVAALLHADWCEVGRSGRLWTRSELLAEIGPLNVPVEFELLSISRVDPESILVLWRSVAESGSTLRSSLWVREGAAWRQRFHQGTEER